MTARTTAGEPGKPFHEEGMAHEGGMALEGPMAHEGVMAHEGAMAEERTAVAASNVDQVTFSQVIAYPAVYIDLIVLH